MPWLKVVVGGKGRKSLVTGIEWLRGGKDVEALVLNLNRLTKKPYQCELVALAVGELGFRENDFPPGKTFSVRGPTYRQVCDRAVQLGFKLCTVEIVATACGSEEFSYDKLQRTHGATFAMAPVVGSDWKARVLRIYESNDPFSTPKLYAAQQYPDSAVGVEEGLILCL